jgi:hypothetical protein
LVVLHPVTLMDPERVVVVKRQISIGTDAAQFSLRIGERDRRVSFDRAV